MREFRVPGRILTGSGSAREVGAILQARAVRHLLVISDPFIMATDAAQAVLASLRRAGFGVTLHDAVLGEPTVTMVGAADSVRVASGADAVVGLGGGSAMDVAKAVAILARNEGPLAQYEGTDRVLRARVPLACIATTAGTGSEVTRYLIVTDEARDRKMLITSWEALPDIAVADPDLTRHVPTRAAIAAGIDALTHAIEAYVGRRAQPLTDAIALSAIRRIAQALPRVVVDPANDAMRAAMSVGALEAGIAFANASVALVHGMARPLGARFGVPHGLANAVLLPAVCAFSWSGNEARYRDIGLAMGLRVSDASAGAQATVRAVRDLCVAVGVPSLRTLGVDGVAYEASLTAMADDAIASGSPAHNPRIATATEIVDLYREVYAG